MELLYTKSWDLLDLPLPEPREQQYKGVKWIYLRHNLQSGFYYWWRGDLKLADWWRSLQGIKWDAVFSWNDQAPFWFELWGSFGIAVKILIAKLTKRRKEQQVI